MIRRIWKQQDGSEHLLQNCDVEGMPYIAVKAFPKDEETKKKVVDQINDIFLNTQGCPQEAITISVEEIAPAEWEGKVKSPDIMPNMDKMMILDGEKKY